MNKRKKTQPSAKSNKSDTASVKATPNAKSQPKSNASAVVKASSKGAAEKVMEKKSAYSLEEKALNRKAREVGLVSAGTSVVQRVNLDYQ